MATLDYLKRGVMAFHYHKSPHEVQPEACGTEFEKGHNLSYLEKLASQLTETEATLFITTGEGEGDANELGWWLESHPEYGPLQEYLTDFFHMGMGL